MPTATETTRAWVYDLNDGSAEMRELLGNKGANLAEMTQVLGPETVPGGFTVTTAACVEYMRNGGQPPAGLDDEVAEALGGAGAAQAASASVIPRIRSCSRSARAHRYRCRGCSTPS